jgi:hypothetical protein
MRYKFLFRNLCSLEVSGKYSNKTMAGRWIQFKDSTGEAIVSDSKRKSNYSFIFNFPEMCPNIELSRRLTGLLLEGNKQITSLETGLVPRLFQLRFLLITLHHILPPEYWSILYPPKSTFRESCLDVMLPIVV